MRDYIRQYKQSGMLHQLMFLNIGVFLVLGIFRLFFYLFQSMPEATLLNWLAVPSYLPTLITRPWTLLSYMFLHENLFHILSNMIMLYFGGRLFTEFLGESRLLPVYLWGGISGALMFILAYNLLPVFENSMKVAIALGASASVLAVFFTIASYLPNYEVNLFLFGMVRLKWLALVILAIDLLSIDKGNPGGHIAHLGGALFGFLYVKGLRRGSDLAMATHRFFYRFGQFFSPRKPITNPGPRSRMKVEYNHQSNAASAHRKESNPGSFAQKSKQEIIDDILDKISRSGYESLTKEEKETIFKISKEQ